MPPSSQPLPDAALPRVTVIPSETSRGRALASAAFSGFLLGASLIGCLVVLFGGVYGFWVLLETVARVFHMGRGMGLLGPFLLTRRGWPNDAAFVLGSLASWSFLYFCHDHLLFRGSPTLGRRLRKKADQLVPGPLPPVRFFVEARTTGKHLNLHNGDAGWLLVFPDRLEFVGDTRHGVFPRASVAGNPVRESSTHGLFGAWLVVPLADPWGHVRFLVRGNATRLSDTEAGAKRLHAALKTWRAG